VSAQSGAPVARSGDAPPATSERASAVAREAASTPTQAQPAASGVLDGSATRRVEPSSEASSEPRAGGLQAASVSENVPLPAAPDVPTMVAREAAPAPAPQPAAVAPSVTPEARPRGGASAALDVLRSAGMRVSTDRGRAAATPGKPAPAPAASPASASAPKPATPRAAVVVPVPRARREESAAPREARAATPSAPAPWDDIPPADDYMPLSAEDAYFAQSDDGLMPAFDSGPDDMRIGSPRDDARFESQSQSQVPQAVDLRTLPPSIALDAVGFSGDWPALAAGLALTGVAYQLAFNSELIALEGETLKLSVPVPQYAESSQVAKLKTALADRLGRQVDVQVEVGPARRTAAALEAAARAERQREAEREIDADPFVQALIRDFGASIVPGSIKPVAPDTGAAAR
jgi:DNA polymerase-3 subunit gamma/tau